MTPRTLIPFVLLAFVSFANAGENALFRAERSCLKYPPSDARTKCTTEEKAVSAAFDKEQQKERLQSNTIDRAGKKQDGLCFTRKATGEVVCSN